jgi:urease accessory protein
MDSRIEIVASLRRGATVVDRIRGGGHFAGRLTGPGEVHLVGTAAGPLGGDVAVIAVEVRAGAALSLRSAAATIVLPGADRPDSVLRIEAVVHPGATLDLALEPTVVCAGAVHRAETVADLRGDARLDLREDVALGRTGETGGRWRGRTTITRDGRALLRHSVTSEVLGARALCTAVTTAATTPPATCGCAVAMPLAAGGTLRTSFGPDLRAARLDLAALDVSAAELIEPSAPGGNAGS